MGAGAGEDDPDPAVSEVRVDHVENVNAGVGSGEVAEARRDHESSSSRLLNGRGDMKVKGEAPPRL